MLRRYVCDRSSYQTSNIRIFQRSPTRHHIQVDWATSFGLHMPLSGFLFKNHLIKTMTAVRKEISSFTKYVMGIY